MMPPDQTPDEADPSLRLLDQLFDEAGDAAVEEDGPIDDRGKRLAAMALAMVDTLAADLSDGRPLPQDDDDAIDTARIVAMGRGPLRRLVTRLCSLRGETPVPSLDALSEDELRAVVWRLRAPNRHA